VDIVEIMIDKIKPYSKNPRKNDSAVEIVVRSIRDYGFVNPIIVDKKHVIIAGHTRYLAAKELGLEKVPVIIADHLPPKKVRAYRILDNKSSEYSEWDWDLLKGELDALGNLDTVFTGFDEDELKSILGDVDSTGFPDLNDGGKGEFEQITFTLHSDQAEVVRDAIDKILDDGVDDSLNDNKNGNAIYEICLNYLKHLDN